MTAPSRTLPHDPYIRAVTDALTAAGLEPTEQWTDDSDSRGTYCYLNAVVTLDPSGTNDLDLDLDEIPAGTTWPHGLLLIWEWHTGIEDAEPERGPRWQFAELKKDGRNEHPTVLPVAGYASPDAVVDAVRKVVAREIRPTSFDGGLSDWRGALIGRSWQHAEQFDTACQAWGANEAASGA